MNNGISGIILAGGNAKRMKGNKKAFLEVGGRRIIDRLFEIYREIFEDIVIVTNTPSDFIEFDAVIVPDIIDRKSSMAGIHAGLFYAVNDMAFVSACDTPFLKKSMIELVISNMKSHYDSVMPVHGNGFLEPLCAAYSRRLVRIFSKSLSNGILTIRDSLSERRVITIPEEKIKKADPDLLSFFNINTPEDLEKANRLDQ